MPLSSLLVFCALVYAICCHTSEIHVHDEEGMSETLHDFTIKSGMLAHYTCTKQCWFCVWKCWSNSCALYIYKSP